MEICIAILLSCALFSLMSGYGRWMCGLSILAFLPLLLLGLRLCQVVVGDAGKAALGAMPTPGAHCAPRSLRVRIV
ncbi:MAG: hypothetical protein ACKVX7_13615 [Planctomycetota bacterium]